MGKYPELVESNNLNQTQVVLTLSNLSAGSYDISVSDSNGNNTSLQELIEILQPPPLNVSHDTSLDTIYAGYVSCQ